MAESEKSRQLYEMMLKRGYPEPFVREVCMAMNTDWTASRMIGYLAHYKKRLPLEEVADEVLAILADRHRIMEKKVHEHTNAKWNEHLNRGLDEEQ